MKINLNNEILNFQKHLIISLIIIFISVLNIYSSSMLSQEIEIDYTVEKEDVALENEYVTFKSFLDELEKESDISFLFEDNLKYKLHGQIKINDLDHNANHLGDILSQVGIEMEEVEENFFVLKPEPENQYEPLTAYVNVPSYKGKGDVQQQEITVTGTVVSADDGEPIPGASVTITGTTIGTTTDVDGEYSIEVPDEEATLEFSFVGKESKEVIVGDQRTIDVELEPDVVGLDEVVVTGYGVQRRRDLTGSVSSVRSDEISDMPVETLGDALQGRAAGVDVVSGDGVPGGGVSMYIRGGGSLTSNSPMYIVDGVEIYAGNPTARTESASILSNIDMSDIESLDILKDAAATAIYGARGANGVVIIETKRGDVLEETEFNFEVSTGFSEPVNTKGLMDGPQFVQWDTERYINRYGADDPRVQDRLEHGVERGWYELGADGMPDLTTVPHYDWYDKAFRTGNIYDARLSARGGDERTRFYTSFSHNYTQGHVIEYMFDRSALRVNLDHEATERLSFDLQSNLSMAHQDGGRLGGAHSSPFRQGAGTPPTEPIYTWQAEEQGIDHLAPSHRGYFGAPRSVYGPYPHHGINGMELDHLINEQLKATVNFSVNYQFTDNLTYRGSAAVDYSTSNEEQWMDPMSGDGYAHEGRLRDYATRVMVTQTTQTLNYDRVIGDVHQINGVAGFETWFREWNRAAFRAEGFPHSQMNVMASAAEVSWFTGNETERSTMGTFSRLNYTYDDRYLITLTGRYDGSSRFGADNRWGFFPAVAVGWRISDEPFMAGFDNIDNLMLRLSYGKSGSDAAGTYAALGLWSGGTSYMGRSGTYPSQLPNRNLTWEENTTLNFSVNLAAFDTRLNTELEVFRQEYSELLLDRPLPRSTGWSGVTDNIGETVNHGIEVAVDGVLIDRENFRWTTTLNFSVTENEVTRLLPGMERLSASTQLGYPRGMHEQAEWAGVNPADGRPMYYDKDGNITYQPTFEDETLRGPQRAPRNAGLTNEFGVGDFRFSAHFTYQGGGYRRNADHRHWFHGTGTRNQYDWTFENRWQEPGDITDSPKPMVGNEYPGDVLRPNYTNHHMVERTDFIRLKSATISYNVPDAIAQRAGLTSARIFARGSNLLTWTDYRGVDPEFTGTDHGKYPQGRNVTFGIQTSF